MKKIFIPIAIIFACLIQTNLFAQSWGFAQYGHWAQDIAIAPDGNVWATGYGGDDPLWMDVTLNYVAKLTSGGEKLWGTSVAGLPWGISALNVMPVADGGAVIYGGIDFFSPGMYKLDGDGNLIWTSPWTGSGYLYGGIGVQLIDGRFVVGGLSEFIHNFYEVDADGNLIASFSMDADTTGGFAWSYWNFKEIGMLATADGGFLYATGNDISKLLYKYDSGMNLEWSTSYDWILSWEYGFQNCLKGTADGGYLLSGSGTDAGGIYYGTVRKLSSSGILEWENTFNHGGGSEEGALALGLDDEYIVWTQDEGDNSSAGWITDLAGTEIGSENIPIINCTWGFGETGMEVWDVENTSDGGYLIAGRQWLEDCDQRFTIIKSNPDGSFDPCIFNCVWPGDANNDGYGEATDLFEIGINYGATGFTRDDMGIDWSGKLSRAWMEDDSVFWYILNDLKWTDCNGDGTINDDDTTAVINNLGLDHPLNTLRIDGGDIPLYLLPEDDVLNVGLNQIPIMLGDELNSIDEIYGISFTISIEGESIDASSIIVNFNESWIGGAGETLSLSKNFGDTKQVVSGIVRKDRENISGDGQVGTLNIVVVDNITGKIGAEEFEFSFSNVTAIKLNREIIPVTSETLTISSEETGGIDQNNTAAITLFPNPARDVVYLNNNSGYAVQNIKITDITGKMVFENNNISTTLNSIDISLLEVGNYIVEINNGYEIISQKISIL